MFTCFQIYSHWAIPSKLNAGHVKTFLIGDDDSSIAAQYVRCVQGNDYAINNYSDNNDGSVTNNATGLITFNTNLQYR